MKNKNNEVKRSSESVFAQFSGYIKAKYCIILLFVLGFAVASALNFFNIATSQTIASFSLNDFEIGQIADRTIIATNSIPADVENPISIEAGERIIRKGFPITEDGFAKLRKMAAAPVYLDYRAFANTELYLLVIAIVWSLLFAFLPFGRKIQKREMLLHVVFFLLVYGITAFGRKTEIFSSPFALPIIIPASLCVLLLTILYGQLSGVLFAIIASFGVFNASQWAPVPFLYAVISCIAAANVVRKIERRIDMVVASLLLAVIDVACIVVCTVIFSERFSAIAHVFGGVAFNGFISGIFALGFLTPLEMILNTASVFRLMDLSDLNNPTMRKLMITASGTYSHSMMVAQLAESACREIGANALLARVGAYYHDIGKMEQSEYFVENQTGINKHDDINPSLSVAVIKSHVKKGVEKAHQMHLPQQVIDIIAEHHGNSIISYFYNEVKAKDPNVNPEDFRYTGVPPTTRESAVVMLADTTEAACRTLENPSASRLEKFIQELFNAKVDNRQLDNCSLTFRDMSKIKEAFVQLLAGYYHNRIEYPNQKDPDALSKNSKGEEEHMKQNGRIGERQSKSGEKKVDTGK
ncbi:MAG: HDIG domain-containing protein [Treponema sp.]|nr:HDIG domain-containing protein [Treponema sp.]